MVAHPFGLSFLNDDFIHIPEAAEGHFFHSNLLRPVSDITLWVDHFFWNWNATGFHFTNIVIHLANCFLAYKLYSGIFKYRNREHSAAIAIAAALLFTLYAFHSESVFWIIGRGGSLAAFFMLISLNCYFISRRMVSMCISLLSFVAGLFTYEFTWVLPLFIIVFQVWDLYYKRPSAWRWTLSFVFVFIIYLLVRLKIDSAYFSNYESAAIRELRIEKLITNYFATLVRCFLPPMKNSNLFIGATVGVWLLITACAVYILKKRNPSVKYLVLPLCLMMIACLPSISLGIDTHDGEGGRFLYVPSIFFCWFIIELICSLFSSMQLRILLIGLLMIVHGFWFYLASKEYRYASRVVKGSLKCISEAPSADTLIVMGLPSQYKGALIFRSGFENAVRLFNPGKFKTVRIVSQQEIYLPVNYSCIGLVLKSHYPALYINWREDGKIYFIDTMR